jgi:hypothetical protein
MIYSAYKIGNGLLNGFSFIDLILSNIVERDLIYNISYIIVELPVTSVLVVNTRFLNLRTID